MVESETNYNHTTDFESKFDFKTPVQFQVLPFNPEFDPPIPNPLSNFKPTAQFQTQHQISNLPSNFITTSQFECHRPVSKSQSQFQTHRPISSPLS
jgi:hypothetical protein